VVFDAGSHRVYVAHGDRVTVVDGRDGTIVGQVEGFPVAPTASPSPPLPATAIATMAARARRARLTSRH